MATQSQRQRKLARRRFHAHQSAVKRAEAARQHAEELRAARRKHVPQQQRRSALIVDEPVSNAYSRSDLEDATVPWLRTKAKSLGIKRTSLMRKGALIDAILNS